MHAYLWNRKLNLRIFLRTSVLSGWNVLLVAPHCRIDDPIDILELWVHNGWNCRICTVHNSPLEHNDVAHVYGRIINVELQDAV